MWLFPLENVKNECTFSAVLLAITARRVTKCAPFHGTTQRRKLCFFFVVLYYCAVILYTKMCEWHTDCMSHRQVQLVVPLKGTDPAQLLLDLKPRPFKYTELGTSPGCSHADMLRALTQHKVLEEAKGHPGTLVRLAPLLTDHYLGSPVVQEMAARYECVTWWWWWWWYPR